MKLTSTPSHNGWAVCWEVGWSRRRGVHIHIYGARWYDRDVVKAMMLDSVKMDVTNRCLLGFVVKVDIVKIRSGGNDAKFNDERTCRFEILRFAAKDDIVNNV